MARIAAFAFDADGMASFLRGLDKKKEGWLIATPVRCNLFVALAVA